MRKLAKVVNAYLCLFLRVLANLFKQIFCFVFMINLDVSNNYKIVVPTTNLAKDFYNAFDYKVESIKLCINYGAFKDIKLAFDNNARIIITKLNYTQYLDVKIV